MKVQLAQLMKTRPSFPSWLFLLGIVVVVASSVGACSSSWSGGDGGRDRGRITREELASPPHYNSAYDAVQQLRPQWLIIRGDISPNTRNPIMVYLDGSRYGTAESLRQITVGDVESMRFLKSSEAAAIHGRGNANGVIEVTTRDGG